MCRRLTFMDKMKLARFAAFVLNRDVPQGEAVKAAGYRSRVGFAKADEAGKIPLDRIVTACNYWGITHPEDALIIMGYMDRPADDWTPSTRVAGNVGIEQRLQAGAVIRQKGDIDTAYHV